MYGGWLVRGFVFCCHYSHGPLGGFLVAKDWPGFDPWRIFWWSKSANESGWRVQAVHSPLAWVQILVFSHPSYRHWRRLHRFSSVKHTCILASTFAVRYHSLLLCDEATGEAHDQVPIPALHLQKASIPAAISYHGLIHVHMMNQIVALLPKFLSWNKLVKKETY